jgi:hypothetical protein
MDRFACRREVLKQPEALGLLEKVSIILTTSALRPLQDGCGARALHAMVLRCNRWQSPRFRPGGQAHPIRAGKLGEDLL